MVIAYLDTQYDQYENYLLYKLKINADLKSFYFIFYYLP